MGQKRPNAFSLFDMHGNVWEWCPTGIDEDFYGRSPVDDPLGPFERASVRVIRGGSWRDVPLASGRRTGSGRAGRPGPRPGFPPGPSPV